MRLSSMLWILSTLFACQPQAAPEYHPRYEAQPLKPHQVYLLGVHPLHNPARLNAIFAPLAEQLSQGGVRVQLEASRSYAAYDQKLYSGHFHLALPNPYQTINALNRGYRVVAKVADDQDFRGIILVRKDAGITDARQLQGRPVSFPAPTALAATMMPQLLLHEMGVHLQDLQIRYVGSQESSIMNVYLGQVAAGATWPPPWRALIQERPEIGEALEVRWETAPLPNNSFMAREDLKEVEVERIVSHLLALRDHPRGREILSQMEAKGFERADAGTYAPVRRFIEHFKQHVRPVELLEDKP
ncbi:phosphate/phosphite/phosphonate ABC transporter substrate-binding protein [Myxococcota bacterium]|nr:phosphate/phosphite/phosphonate ABC transporter substrate-binding protein [Myxococcota bacterium]MBU1430945.1 phosphate/phosphite/phosphonate ABC transporter substrate-binding protein [Myxococcota bacterium]MBU1897261.1 phosphate/phosphite/phosphonate ABC transporter substrate-binding protein [Myxococcota bacterium]